MSVIILRFFFVYGPGQKSDMLIPRLVDSVKGGKPIILQGKDGIRINPTYVSDAVEAIQGALKLKASQKINVGGPEIISLREIGDTIGQIIGREPKYVMDNEAEPHNLMGDIRKMSRLIGEPRVSFREGIKRYVEHEKKREKKEYF